MDRWNPGRLHIAAHPDHLQELQLQSHASQVNGDLRVMRLDLHAFGPGACESGMAHRTGSRPNPSSLPAKCSQRILNKIGFPTTVKLRIC